MILYINSTIRSNSRTDYIAREYLKNKEYRELKLIELNLKPLDEDTLNKRASLISKNDFSDSMFNYAKMFKEADEIVISAPNYDLSFPSTLKIFIENIYIINLVSKYNELGIPVGLCKTNKLTYIATSGGPYNPKYSYDYIKDLAINSFGIKEVELIVAENLDIINNNSDEIINDVIEKIKR